MPELQVRVGHSLDSLKPIPINARYPATVKSDAFEGQVGVHVRNYRGGGGDDDNQLRSSEVLGPDASDAFCISIRGRFLQPQGLCADDIVFGNRFERPLKLPVGTSLAVAFAHWFDPGLEANLYCSQPQAFSPLIVTMNRLAIHVSKNNNREHVDDGTTTKDLMVKNDDVSAVINNEDVVRVLDTADMRRKYFADPAHRKAVKVTPDLIWNMAFMNPYIDFNKFVVHLPMMDINVLKYWDGQPLRYYAKTKDDSTIFFIIEFNLV